MLSKGEITKDRILAEASLVFNRKGINATSVSDLLTATGTTRGNLYFHFSGKQALALAVLNREREQFMDFLDQSLSKGTPGKALDNFLQQAYTKHQQTNFIGGCLFGNTALEASDSTPVFANLIMVVFNDWIEKVESVILAAQQSQEVRADLPAHDLAATIVATIEGGIMQSRLFKTADPLRNCLNTLRTMLNLQPAADQETP